MCEQQNNFYGNRSTRMRMVDFGFLCYTLHMHKSHSPLFIFSKTNSHQDFYKLFRTNWITLGCITYAQNIFLRLTQSPERDKHVSKTNENVLQIYNFRREQQTKAGTFCLLYMYIKFLLFCDSFFVFRGI